MAKAPLWSVGDMVYLRESAVLGFLEGYKVTNIIYDPGYNRWMYEIAIKHKGTEPSTTIDMYNLRTQEVLRLGENDLISQGEAVDLAIINTEQRLEYLKQKKANLG